MGADAIDEALFDAEEKWEKAVAVARDICQLSVPGRATLACSLGSSTTTPPRSRNLAASRPEARLVVIKLQRKPISCALSRLHCNSDLSESYQRGALIRVVVPQLTEERRRELVKQAKHKGG